MVEQAARVPNSRRRAHELLRNSLRSFSDPDPVPKCSLTSASLRPNCPVCGPAEGAGTSWSQAEPWSP